MKIIIIAMILSILLVLLYYQSIEPFTCSACLDQMPRYVKINKTGNIMYINHLRPSNGNFIECPSYVNKLTTLGDINYCYK